MTYYRKQKGRTYRRQVRRKKNYKPLFLVLLILGLFVFAVFKLFEAFNSHASDTEAELKILKGQARFSFAENDDFALASTGQKFLTGDRIATGSNSRVSLEFFNGNTIFLGSDSDLEIKKLKEKSATKRNVELILNKGKMWAYISADDFPENSYLFVETPRARINVRGTIFDLESNEKQDVIRLIKGKVDTDVFLDDSKTKNIKIGVGQKLVLDETNLARIKIDQEPVEMLDSDFVNSEWHLRNLEQFLPKEVSGIRDKIDKAALEELQIEEEGVIEAPQITSPLPGQEFSADTDSIKIEGIAPENAFQISVNGYLLSLFQPGDRKWSYFAARKFGTLLPGENIFTVVAVTQDGKKSKPAVVKVFHHAPQTVTPETVTQEAEVVKNTEQTEQTEQIEKKVDYTFPKFIEPVVSSKEAEYKTSETKVVIAGIVDPKTTMVTVNDFKLKKFQPGDTNFYYTANALLGNMEVGENIYMVVTYGQNGETAKNSIKIVYTPAEQ